jgi:WD40 repeat protein
MKKLTLTILLFILPRFISAQDFPFQTGHSETLLNVKFNPVATKLISYSVMHDWLILWDVGSGRQIWRTQTEFVQKAKEYYTLTSFAFSPDESLVVSGSVNGTIQLWDAKTGKPLWRTDAHGDNVTAVAFSPDGNTIVSAASLKKGEDEIKTIRAEDGKVLKKLQGKSCTVVAMTFSENGKILKTGNLDGNVTEWDLETGEQDDSKPAMPCRTKRINDWETSYTSNLEIALKRTGEKELSLIDTQTGSETGKINADGALYIRSKISGDGKALAYSKSGDFVIHDLETGKIVQIDTFSGSDSAIDISHNGNLFAEGKGWGGDLIRITDSTTGQSKLLTGHPGVVKAIAYTSDGNYLAIAGNDRNIYVIDASKHTLLKALVGHKGPIDSIAFSPDGRILLSCSKAENVRLWRWQDISEKNNYFAFDIEDVKKVAFSPDGKQFYMMGDDKVYFTIADAESLKIIHTLATNKKYEETSGDMTVGYKGIPIYDLAFSEDGKNVISSHYDGALRFWNIHTGKQVRRLNVSGRALFIQTSRDGKSILAAFQANNGDYQIKLIDAKFGKAFTEFSGEETSFIRTLILSPDGQHFATSDILGHVLLWAMAAKKPIREFDIGPSGNQTIAFSPDGRVLAVGGKNQNLFLYEVPTGNKLWQLIPSYEPTELEIRLIEEKKKKEAQLDLAQERRNEQASIDAETLKKQVYITFEHFGDMKNSGELRRLFESDEPDKSKVKKPPADSNAVWLRLHNDTPLPIRIPTHSMYRSNKNCFYSYADNQKLFGLCNDREIYIQFGLEDKNGKPLRYGPDFGSRVILLPKTSALFPVPKWVLKGNNSILFFYSFQKESDENEIDDYGEKIMLRFRKSDLPKTK